MKDFKQGDYFVCLPGFNTVQGDIPDAQYGGNGYEEHYILKIKRIDGDVIFPHNNSYGHESGIYHYALRKATPEEAALYEENNRPVQSPYSKEEYIVESFPLY